MEKANILATRADKNIYRDGGKVVKVFDESYKKSDILNEALNQARVEEAGLPAPRVLEVCKIEGKWAIVMDYIEGDTLDKLMRENPGKADEYMNLFVDLQLEMHTHRAPLLNPLLQKMQRKIGESGLSATTRYELSLRLDSMPRHDKVCHGDFNPSNIILTPQDKPFIIDWSHATRGNASHDAARTYLLFNLAGQTEQAEQYLRLFCEKSDTALQYVQQWLPIVAASQLVKGKPEERDFLLRWADVVQYE